MGKIIVRLAVAAMAAGVLAAGSPAQANSVLFTSANSPATAFAVGSLDYWVTGCNITIAGNSGSCASLAPGLQLVSGSSSWNNSSVTIDSTAGHIFNIPAASFPVSTNQYDLSFDLNVATIQCVASGGSNCANVITSDALSITGSAPAGVSNFDSDLTVGETAQFPLSGAPQVGPVTATAAQAQPTLLTFPGAQSYVLASKDIGDQLTGITGGLTGPVTIDTITQNFGIVPEPASMGVFLVSLAALGAVRRRNSRSISPR